jgi:hypothetical protein
VRLSQDLGEIAVAAGRLAEAGEELAAIIPTEPAGGARVYLCAFAGTDGSRTWLALNAAGEVIADRRLVRDAVAIAALCEAAEEAAASGVDAVRDTRPRLATPAYLDELGAAARKLEQTNGDMTDSPFAQAMRVATQAVEELERDVERGYKVPLR